MYIPKMDRAPGKHIPVAILIDCSESASEIRPLLDQAIRNMVRELQRDLNLRQIVELLVIHFNDTLSAPVKFAPVCSIDPNQLNIASCEGTTHTGWALLNALQLLRELKTVYDGKQEKCSKPLLFLFTDGYPDAGGTAAPKWKERVRSDYQEAARQIKAMEQADQIYFCAAGIQRKNGASADMDTLRQLSNHPERIIQVIGDTNGSETISLFCKAICDSADNLYHQTPPEASLDVFL